MKMTVREEIIEAIEEAKILECARDIYEENHMLFIAQKLSGAPFSFVKEVYNSTKPAFEFI
jgi:hypothetical protein